MNALIFLTIVALASPIYAEEVVQAKKQEKRGLLGLGYAAAAGYHGGLLSGYGGHLGYLGAPAVYSALSHGVAPAPVSHAYSAPISVSHGYTAPVLSAPLHVGSGSLGLGYVHGW